LKNNWRSNNGASKRVAELLQQAGVPLELQVAEISKLFCNNNAESTINVIKNDKVIYSPSGSQEEYREIDQRVQIYDEFEANEFTGVQLLMNMLIESKYRIDVEYFSFPSMTQSSRVRFPISSTFAGSNYLQTLNDTFDEFKDFPLTSYASVEIKDGKNPNKVYKENLLYKAAGALYDFISFDISQTFSDNDLIAFKLIDKLGLFTDFKDYIKRTRYAWWATLRNWLNKIDDEKHKQFNQQYFEGSRLYYMVSCHLPIVCVNGQIHKVKWTLNKGITDFTDASFFLSSIRKHAWPGQARYLLLQKEPEVPFIVTNPLNLISVLEIGLIWYKKIRKALKEADAKLINRWPLESALYKRIVQHYHFKDARLMRSYHPDLDFDKLL